MTDTKLPAPRPIQIASQETTVNSSPVDVLLGTHSIRSETGVDWVDGIEGQLDDDAVPMVVVVQTVYCRQQLLGRNVIIYLCMDPVMRISRAQLTLFTIGSTRTYLPLGGGIWPPSQKNHRNRASMKAGV